MSWSPTLSPPLAKVTPVSPPTVKRNKNPKANNRAVSHSRAPPKSVANQLNIFIPVGMAMIIVAAVK